MTIEVVFGDPWNIWEALQEGDEFVAWWKTVATEDRRRWRWELECKLAFYINSTLHPTLDDRARPALVKFIESLERATG